MCNLHITELKYLQNEAGGSIRYYHQISNQISDKEPKTHSYLENKKYLRPTITQILAHAFVISKLDYFNSLLHGLQNESFLK